MASNREAKVSKNPRAKGLKLVGVRFEPEQVEALRNEALRRASERGKVQLDVSEIVREGVELVLKRKAKRK